jgi:hypothetical protein
VGGTDLYAGGYFTTAGGVNANHIAKWNGSDWSALGSGTGGSYPGVEALAANGIDLYAGGMFTTAGGVLVNCIAKWNGSTWSALSSGITGGNVPDIYALTASGTDLYAGGNFTTAGGVPAKCIAKWNGSAWSALGSGVGGGDYPYVDALAVSGTDLYAGGSFTNAGGVMTKYVAQWNGNAWSALGSGINNTVFAMATDELGHLFVGGAFSLAGTNVSPYIAQAYLGRAPNIFLPPQSQTAGQGTTVDFVVDAVGDPVLTYLWFFNGTNPISWGTNPSLVLTNCQFSQSGAYTVVVTNLFGSTTSSPAMLNVIAIAPTILSPPMNQMAALGFTANFSVSANGSLPLSYQWVFNGTNFITDATNAVLHLENVQYSQAGPYAVVVTNAFGAVTSSPAMLDVLLPIVTQCTEGNLRTAMAGGGTVTFTCDGIITLGNTITIDKDTVLDASGHQITISGNSAVRVFYVNTNVIFTVINLTIANGRSDSGAGIFNDGGTVTATNSQFVGNRAQGAPGADGSPGQNGQNGYGGALYNSGVFKAINCTFIWNTVVGGAGGLGWSYVSPYTGGDGGAGDGGAICSFGALAMAACTFASNSACGGAGGVGGSPQRGQPYGLRGGDGGAGGHGNGGTLFNGGSAYMVNDTFALNSGAGGQGGGGGGGGAPGNPDYSGGNGGNGGAGGAGYSAIYDSNGQCYLTNGTLAMNWATAGIGGAGGSGGRVTDPGFPPHPGNPGLSGTNGSAGGGIRTTGGLLDNTLLSANAPSNCSGIITDAGHNLSSDSSCAFTGVGSLNNTDAKLGPLADNGGPTLTVALLSGSPAINAGASAGAPTTDQRGVTRPQGPGVDIGAFEYQYIPMFSSAEFQTPTSFRLQMSGLLPAQAFKLQTSTNLLNWSDLTNFVAGSSDVYEFVDCNPGNCKARFYRLKFSTP